MQVEREVRAVTFPPRRLVFGHGHVEPAPNLPRDGEGIEDILQEPASATPRQPPGPTAVAADG